MSEIPEIQFEINPSSSVPVPVDDTLSVSGQAADAAAVGSAITSLSETVAANLSSAVNTLNGAIAALFPVGAIYVSTSDTAPQFFGSWVEILLPVTWDDLHSGARDYADIEESDTPGTLHFWRRTE